MERDAENGQAAAAEHAREQGSEGAASDGLLDKLGLIESQPLEHRARGFEQLHDELLQELQRSDQGGA